MTKANTLYFIRILQNALKGSDKKQALKAAFLEIREKGSLPEYSEGYENFRGLMKIIEEHVASEPGYIDEIKSELMESKILDLATDTFRGSDHDRQQIMDFIKENPDLYSEYEQIRSELAILLPGTIHVQIEIIKDGQSFGSFDFSEKSNSIVIDDVTPGEYSIGLSTGRLLWEGKLADEDLIWAKAYPKEKLPAAAETVPIRSKPTLTEPLLEGEINLEIFPWLKSGVLYLTLRDKK